jgi:UDP-2,3-diacylglucosamine hydrolase
MTTLFISDLHLEADKPRIGEQFLAFLRNDASQADALYILGDLFEAWLGDDDPNPYYTTMKTALRKLVDSGVPTYFMHGNRDFMIAADFADETGVCLLEDPTRIDLHGARVLLIHGDALCTDDVEYQQVRSMTRDPKWQDAMRSKSIEERIAFAQQAREASMAHGATLDNEICDVNQGAVVALLRAHDVDILLHGHTHRPAVHRVDVDGRTAQRIVLGDWYTHGSCVRWTSSGPELLTLER